MLHQVGSKAAEKVTSEQALGEGEGACGETGVRRDMDKGAEVGCAWHVRRTNKE